jgi:hypothetical protein
MSDESELQAEFGSNDGALFIEATACDSEGNTIETPECSRCKDGYRTMLIGNTHSVWICSCGAVL